MENGKLWMVVPVVLAVMTVSLVSNPGRAVSQTCESYAQDHVLVRMNDGASADAIETMKSLNGDGGEYESRGLANLWVVSLPAGLTVPEAVDLYNASPEVKYAQPDYYYYIPEDPCMRKLGTEISGTPEPVRVNELLTLTVTVTNGGPDEVTGASVSAHVPAGVRLDSSRLVVGASERDCPQNGNGVAACEVGNLAVGEKATLTMVVRPTLVGPLRVEAWADAENRSISQKRQFETFVLAPERCTISGSEGADFLTGTPGRDVICTFGGNDRIYDAKDGGDTIYAGPGRDLVRGGRGADLIYGGAGEDRLAGDDGTDQLYGGADDDTLRARDGVEGNDRTYGGPGDDTISSDFGDRTRE